MRSCLIIVRGEFSDILLIDFSTVASREHKIQSDTYNEYYNTIPPDQSTKMMMTIEKENTLMFCTVATYNVIEMEQRK